MKRFLIALTIAAAAAVVPSAAHAAGVAVETKVEGSDIMSDPAAFGQIRYSANAGETNSLTVTADPDGTVRFGDTGAPLTPGKGCTAITANSARCDPRTGGVPSGVLLIDLGDGDDRLNAAPGLPEVHAGPGDDTISAGGKLVGEAGNDTLTGGPGTDRLFGGPGSDTLDGAGGDDNLIGDGDERSDEGSFVPPEPPDPETDTIAGGDGSDTLYYWDRGTGVTVDLVRGVAGENGEADKISSAENARASGARDRLLGDGGPNVLDGSGGTRVTIEGRGGNDTLMGGDRDDVLQGDAGNDTLLPREGDDRIDGGTGDDVLTIFDPDDAIEEEDAGADRVTCGAGGDRVVRPIAVTRVTPDCERVEVADQLSIAITRSGSRVKLALRALEGANPACRVSVTLRSTGKKKRVVASATVRNPSSNRDSRATFKPTEDGRALLQRPKLRLRVDVSSRRGCRARDRRWTPFLADL